MRCPASSHFTTSVEPRPTPRTGAARVVTVFIGLLIALFSALSYWWNTSKNPITNEEQRVAMTVDQEIALGLQAAPEMAAQHGGLHPDQEAQALVDRVGQKLLAGISSSNPYEFEFHLLSDRETINAFALPGGQIFITAALFEQLQTEGQLAGVLAHEIGHVIERHGAERLAKMQLTQGLAGAAVIASYDPEEPRTAETAAVAQAIGALVNMSYSRSDELESDQWAVRLMANSDYDPRAMLDVMDVLARAGGGGMPEFFSTHPNPSNRKERIAEAIEKEYPKGLPDGLQS